MGEAACQAGDPEGDDGKRKTRNPTGEWLSLKEAAAMLGVHPATLRAWADAGRIPSQRTAGGTGGSPARIWKPGCRPTARSPGCAC
jgi:excisionase family DNA binding protein